MEEGRAWMVGRQVEANADRLDMFRLGGRFGPRMRLVVPAGPVARPAHSRIMFKAEPPIRPQTPTAKRATALEHTTKDSSKPIKT